MKGFRYLAVGLVAAAFVAGCTDDGADTTPLVEAQFGEPGTDPVNVNLLPNPPYPAGVPSPVLWGYPTAARWNFPFLSNVGTGRIDPFLTIQNSPREYGFNTDGNWDKKLYDMTRPQFVDAIKVSDIPTVEEGGNLFKEILFDANENNSTLLQARFAVNTFNLWVCDDGGDSWATVTEPGQFRLSADCELVYYVNELGEIDRGGASDAVTRGSGQLADYLILFPDEIFPNSECEYQPGLPSDCKAYVIAELDLGDETDEDWDTNATFEELSVILRPKLEIEKSANASFDRTYFWEVTKQAVPDEHFLGLGTSGTSVYTITADTTGSQDSNFQLSGVITVSNPACDKQDTGCTEFAQAAVVDEITDELPNGGPTLSWVGGGLTCTDDGGAPVSPGYEMSPDEEIYCAYGPVAYTPNGEDINTACVDFSDPEDPGTELQDDCTEAVVVEDTEPTNVYNDSVNVYDTYEDEDPVSLGTASVDDVLAKSFNRSRTWTFPVTGDLAECGEFNNTAQIYYVNDGVEGALADDAQETVNVYCTDVTVTKTVNTYVTKTWNWTIEKAATPDWALFTGESGTSDYTITLDKVDFDYSDWRVDGVITVENTGLVDVTINTVADVLSNGADFAATVGTCTPALPQLLEPGETLTCPYDTEDGLASGNYDTNVATATDAGGADWVSDPYDVSFDEADATVTEVHASVNVEDDYATPGDAGDDLSFGPFSDDDVIEYERTFTCDADEGLYTNTAYLLGDEDAALGDDDATVDVDCYTPTVVKTADEFFDRQWDWEIEKDFSQDFIDQTDNLECTEPDANGDRICTATLGSGANLTVQYTVTVDADFTDFNWQVTGDITVTNPHPTRAAELTEVTDVISNVNGQTVTCSALSVPAAGELVCTYDTGQSAATDNPFDGETNTATATQQLYDFASDLTATPAGTADYSDDELIAFGSVPENAPGQDYCASVDDQLSGFPTIDLDGQVCGDEVPATYTYERVFSNPDDCDQTFINTATVYPEDFDPPLSDSEQLDIECEEGCTLTQGFYKTHSASGPAPYSEIWALLGDPDQDTNEEEELENLFGSNNTWIHWFWTSPSGGNDWIKLSHQWMAAYLNTLANFTYPTGCDAAQDAADGTVDGLCFGVAGGDLDDHIQDGAELLAAYAGTQDIPGTATGSLTGKTAGQIHSYLAAYNEGDIGPGHCTENQLPFIIQIYGQPNIT